MKNNDDSHVRLKKKLQSRRSEHKYRTLQPVGRSESSRMIQMGGTAYLNFSSNDYLNLSNHPAVKEKCKAFVDDFGSSSSSSRLITGSLNIHKNLEERIASLYKKEKALLFSTGFQANSTILATLTNKNDIIIADELCHNSILTGCLSSKASFYRFRHNDLNHLETFLNRKSTLNECTIWIVTESIFSMDGDRAPLEKIIDLAEKYGAKLYVDDAHALGVVGKSGLGYGEDFPEIDLLVSTFGKAGGSFGAFASSSNLIIEALINYCNGFIYTTALPPSVVGSIQAAFDQIPGMYAERNHLQELSVFLHSGIKNTGFKTSDDPSHILPIIYGDEKDVLKKSELLKETGIIVTAIRPPTVPDNSSRFRISLTSAHQKEDCKKLLDVLKE